jgi:hypothetical protein
MTLAALQVVVVLRARVPLPLLVVLERTTGETLMVSVVLLFQVIGLSCVNVIVADEEVIKLLVLIVMDRPMVQAVVVFIRKVPPFNVRKSATSAPLPNLLNDAKSAVP